MENVPLRICSSKYSPDKGPDIQEGDIIRIHRVNVNIHSYQN